MSAQNTVPDDLRVFVRELFDMQQGVLSLQYAELAALLVPARNVRSVPAQRFTAQTLTLGGTTSDLDVFQVIGRRADVKRVRVTLVTIYAADPGTDVVRVGATPDSVNQLSTSSVLNAQRRSIEVDVNMCDVWIGVGANMPAAGALVSIDIEEYDPTAVQSDAFAR